ncbi:MAG TPA: twin-arginine translocase TatA/TatE family subunit, partial [Candidatus Limnocylindria bacterium]|nr:twin-arginine translocase TatA/TatE family subunit [Candidatus Limnocylindria bacterium]
MPIGPWELLVLLVIVLIIFGPGKLPDVGNAIGRGIREFRRASSDIEDAVRGEPPRAEAPRAEPPRTETAATPAPVSPAAPPPAEPVATAEPTRR